MYYFLRASLYDIYWSHMSCNSNNSNNIDSIDTYYRDIANAMFSPLRESPDRSGYSSSKSSSNNVSNDTRDTY